ncbi:CHAT domain-containing tetratricopeptide repeat protein [Catenulispora rubra]|uniref:CHAT domain-containing tetratricopeptide repeat protein n=1 Tax=Catenulispora rubra TaxID=280293 RepID=UPI0018925F1A|nr:CHAT domain-containing tetratricopeptide repeat protein [Catenulispora rubra]
MNQTRDGVPAEAGLLAVIQQAHQLLGMGRNEDAHTVLSAFREAADSANPVVRFAFFRLFGQAARLARQFDEARLAYTTAHEAAQQTGDLNVISGALEGLALVEYADERFPEADQYMTAAVSMARESGDPIGHWATVNNYAAILSKRDTPKAVELYQEALSIPGVDALRRGISADNLGVALMRQERFTEAVEQSKIAIALLHKAGARFDLVTAIHNLAKCCLAFDPEAAAPVFVQAHDLAHLLFEQLPVEHYTTAHAVRVQQIEEATRARISKRDGELSAFTEIMISARAAMEATEHGEHLVSDHKYSDAELQLRQAEARWTHLEAHHCLPRVWIGLGNVYMESGDYEAAWQHLERAKQLANQLGDAPLELLALVNQCSLATRSEQFHEAETLLLLAKARGLKKLIANHITERIVEWSLELNRPAHIGVPVDDGTAGILDGIASTLAGSFGATELEELYLRSSVNSGRLFADSHPARLAYRRSRLLDFLLRHGRDEEAAQLVAELEASLNESTDVALTFVVNTRLGRLEFDEGHWNEAALRRLEEACSAYDRLRLQSVGVGEVGRFDSLTDPPHSQAVEMAIAVGPPERAFELLQTAKSRALLDTLRDRPPTATDDVLLTEEAELWQKLMRLRTKSLSKTGENLSAGAHTNLIFRAGEETERLQTRLEAIWTALADSHPEVRIHRTATPSTAQEIASLLSKREDAVLAEFFVGTKGVYAFIVSAEEIAVQLVLDAKDHDLDEFTALARQGNIESFDRLLAHAGYVRLVELINRIGRRVYIAPYGMLHLVPLHLASESGQPVPRPRTYLVPSASLLRTVHSETAANKTKLVIAGDPLGDLPFARGESAGVAAALNGAATNGLAANGVVRHGGGVTFDWLAEALDGDVRLVHLACHAAFDDARAERSGLLLSGADGKPDRVVLQRLASLNWSGALVVLSSCQSGMHRVRTGDELTGIASTLLAAGATALVTTFRPVPDLSTAVLMLWFYERFAENADWSLESLSDALAAAQRRVATAAARDVASWVRIKAEERQVDLAVAYALLSRAHRTAGEMDLFVSCQERLGQAFAAQLGDDSYEDVIRLATTIGPEYAKQPFHAAANWAPFSITTGAAT